MTTISDRGDEARGRSPEVIEGVKFAVKVDRRRANVASIL
jgi:hypothetical protein